MTKQRKHYTPEEKVAILPMIPVLRTLAAVVGTEPSGYGTSGHLLKKEPISRLCDEVSLQPAVFCHWQKQFFENGAAAFEQRRPSTCSADQARIACLEKKIRTKDQVLAELMWSMWP